MKSWVRRAAKAFVVSVGVVGVLLAGLAAYVLLAWDRPVQRPVRDMAATRDPATVARGRYLYNDAMLCWGCHGSQGSYVSTEPQAGGRAFDLTNIVPGFGIVYGCNVTPDSETGIGGWTDGELVRAIREGVNRRGSVIFPVMSYQFYHGLSDGDALALAAYLRSLPPVRNSVPQRRLSFAAKALIAFGVLKPEDPITSPVQAPAKGPTVEYGRYLAWHSSGCAECHTPRFPSDGKLDTSRPMGGGLFPFPEEDFVTTGPNLTPDRATGIGAWTEQQFVTAVRTGVRPDGSTMLPFMPWPAYGQWSEEEVHAIWVYLRSLAPVTHAIPPSRQGGCRRCRTRRRVVRRVLSSVPRREGRGNAACGHRPSNARARGRRDQPGVWHRRRRSGLCDARIRTDALG